MRLPKWSLIHRHASSSTHLKIKLPEQSSQQGIAHEEIDSQVSPMQPANVVMLCCFTKQSPTSVGPPLHSPVIMALQDSDSDAPSQGHGLSQSKASSMSKGQTGQPVRSGCIHKAVQENCCPGEQNLWGSPGKQLVLLYVVVMMHQL